jgi:metallophosphoesterase superfamily enzyme
LIKKPVKIIILGDAKEELEQLNQIVKIEKK